MFFVVSLRRRAGAAIADRRGQLLQLALCVAVPRRLRRNERIARLGAIRVLDPILEELSSTPRGVHTIARESCGQLLQRCGGTLVLSDVRIQPRKSIERGFGDWRRGVALDQGSIRHQATVAPTRSTADRSRACGVDPRWPPGATAREARRGSRDGYSRPP